MADLARVMRGVLALADAATARGCGAAVPILAAGIAVDERVRLKCRLNACGQYGRNLMCPPQVWDVATTRAALDRYTFALLVQLTRPAPAEEARAVFDREKLVLNDIIVALEQEAFRHGFSLALGLGAGHCQLCAPCAGAEGGACRRPELARPSLEAVGVDVAKTCAEAGLPGGFTPGRVTLTGLLMID